VTKAGSNLTVTNEVIPTKACKKAFVEGEEEEEISSESCDE
jgi:hypothetical protein